MSVDEDILDRIRKRFKTDPITRSISTVITYYLYHPESDCVWTETDRDEVDLVLSTDLLVCEVSKEQYLELKEKYDRDKRLYRKF